MQLSEAKQKAIAMFMLKRLYIKIVINLIH